MPFRFDYHMHTRLSDGKNSHEEMVEAAIEKGFSEIGFSDHFCIKQPCSWAMGADGIQHMIHVLEDLRGKYQHQIRILWGVEVDYFPDREVEIARELEKYPFDYVLGSVHFLDNWNYDSDRSRYNEFSNDYLYHWYFAELQKAASSGLFDTMAHPDLIKKFQVWPESAQNGLFRETAEVFAEAGVAFEVNTSGIDRPCGEFFPGKEFLSELYRADVPVTLGSDSHKAEQIGRYFDDARNMLKELGYRNLVRYRKREKIEEPL